MTAITLLSLAGVVAVLLGLQVRHGTPGVTKENFQRLHVGTTEEQAEKILGRPAGFRMYVTGHHTSLWREGPVVIDIDFSDFDIDGYGAREGVLRVDGEPGQQLSPAPAWDDVVSSVRRRFP